MYTVGDHLYIVANYFLPEILIPVVGLVEVWTVDVETGLIVEAVGPLFLMVDSLEAVESVILIDYKRAFLPKLQRF